MELTRPQALTSAHNVQYFQSGIASLDEWLKRRALANEHSGASRTYVTTLNTDVIGYYALCSGSILTQQATGAIRRNMPDPIPVMVLGRLAVDHRFQQQGIGRALLKDGLLRSLQAAEILGIRAILVHALDERAALFYEQAGFHRSPINPLTLLLSINEVKGASKNSNEGDLRR